MPLKKLISTSPLRETKRSRYFLAGWLLISLLVLTTQLLLPRPALAQGPSVDTTLDENDGSCSDGDCSLRDAIALAAPGDTIVFAPTLAGQTITLTEVITIGKPLTLDGDGLSARVRVSGNDTARVFIIENTAAVTLTNLSLTRGYADYHSECINYGGAICNTGALTLQDMHFTDNHAGNGGAVYSYYGSRLWVNASEFYSNTATDDGGALYVYYDTTSAQVTGSTFMTNTAYNGGAIVNQGAVLTVTGSLISGNRSTQSGGGLYLYDGPTTLAGNTVVHNQGMSGGGVYNFAGTVAITGTHFLTNTGTTGGALYNSRGHLSITQTLIAGNSAADTGGGLFLRQGTATISDSTLRANRTDPSSGRWGGAIFNTDGNNLTLTRSAFTGNQARTDGGGIYNSSAPLTVQAGEFISNTANAGGALYNNGGTLNVSQSAVYSNTATAYGGGLYINGGTATVDASTLAHNQIIQSNYCGSDYGGGGLYNYQGTLTVQNSTLANNAASTNCGGGLYNAGMTTVRASTLSGNSADYGRSFWNASGYLQLQQTLVANSSAGHDCGKAGGTVDSLDGLFQATQENACGVSGDYNTVFGVDPLLGPLGDYGGATLTFALLPNSPAIDAVELGGCLPTDQRGVARPQGARCDIGAFELVPPKMAVLGNNQVIVNGDTSPSAADHTDFGNVVLGGTLTRTFTISNSGGTALSLPGSPVVGLTGPGADNFSVLVQPTTTISPNATAAFQVRFTASVTGTQVATVTIANNDSDENPYDFAIAGTGDSSLRQVYLPLIAGNLMIGSPRGGRMWFSKPGGHLRT